MILLGAWGFTNPICHFFKTIFPYKSLVRLMGAGVVLQENPDQLRTQTHNCRLFLTFFLSTDCRVTWTCMCCGSDSCRRSLTTTLIVSWFIKTHFSFSALFLSMLLSKPFTSKFPLSTTKSDKKLFVPIRLCGARTAFINWPLEID